MAATSPNVAETEPPLFRKNSVHPARVIFLKVVDEKLCCINYSRRWLLAVLCHLGFVVSFGIRCNFGAAKMVMFRPVVRGNITEPPLFHWESGTIAMVEGSFFYAASISVFLAGILAAKFSPVRLFGFGIFLLSIFNLFLPISFQTHFAIPMMVQFVQGFGQGFLYPCMLGTWSAWAPLAEKTKLATTCMTGNYVGVCIGIPLSALLVTHVAWWAPFYIYGAAGIMWSLLWFTFAVSSPAHHPTLSERERNIIMRDRHPNEGYRNVVQFKQVPWRKIISSLPVWAVIVATFSRCWIMYTLINDQLSIMTELLGLSMDMSAALASLPHGLMSVMVLSSGHVADWLRTKREMSTTVVRKLFHCTGIGLEALFMIACAYCPNKIAAVAFLIIGRGFSGLAISGSNVNHLDLSPRYASILSGLAQGIGQIAGMITPFVSELIISRQDVMGWKLVLMVAATLHVASVVFFFFFASGKKQPWNEITESDVHN